MTIRHRKDSPKTDGTDESLIQPSDWDDTHVLAGGVNGQTIVRDSTQPDGWRWDAMPTIPSTLATLDVGQLEVTETIQVAGVLSPPQITADQNNYAPTGLGTASLLRLSSDASRSLTGLQAAAVGRLLFLHNIGLNDLVLVHESSLSTAANRFALGSNLTLSSNKMAVLHYDTTSARWRAAAGSGGGAAGAPGGANTHVQFNDSGVLNGEAAFTYDKLNDTMRASNVTVTGTFEVIGAGAGFTEFTTGTMATGVANTVRIGAQLGNVFSVSANGGAVTPVVLLGGDLAGTAAAPIVERISSQLLLSGIISPAQIAADTNDYNPPNLANASTLRLGTDAARNLTGIAGGASGRILVLHNAGAFPLILKNATTSSAGNQFQFAGDVTLQSNQSMAIQYDGTNSKWRTLGYPTFESLVTLTYGPSVAINAALARTFRVSANNATAFTIANPTNAVLGRRISIMIRNTSGGALGAVTWDTLYKLAAWTSPANGTSRSITFVYDATNWVEQNRTTVDVPN
jgi:hypothetical protein